MVEVSEINKGCKKLPATVFNEGNLKKCKLDFGMICLERQLKINRMSIKIRRDLYLKLDSEEPPVGN